MPTCVHDDTKLIRYSICHIEPVNQTKQNYRLQPFLNISFRNGLLYFATPCKSVPLIVLQIYFNKQPMASDAQLAVHCLKTQKTM